MTESQHALPASKMPDSLLIIGAVALLVFVAAQFITPGYFDVVIPEGAASDRAIIDPDSFRYAEASSPSLFSSDGTPALFNAMFEGLVSGDRTGGAVGIMAFILLTGGAFGVVLGTGAVDRGVIGDDGDVLQCVAAFSQLLFFAEPEAMRLALSAEELVLEGFPPLVQETGVIGRHVYLTR